MKQWQETCEVLEQLAELTDPGELLVVRSGRTPQHLRHRETPIHEPGDAHP